MAKTKFKAGDRVKARQDCSGVVAGEIGILYRKYGALWMKGKESIGSGCACEHNMTLAGKDYDARLI